MRVHFTHKYITNPSHEVTINLIGAGGTGSQVLSGLARMNEALIACGHPGIHVYLFDGDIVTESNVGRQLFSPADVGLNKATCLITRINRFFGYDWEAMPEMYNHEGNYTSNITISCVDTIAARLHIDKALEANRGAGDYYGPLYKPYYWLDFGNSQKSGQVILGTIGQIQQPKKSKYKTVKVLPTCTKHFKGYIHVDEEDNGPSCSLAEALHKQDLYINSTLANLGLSLLWKLMREGIIVHRGLFLNLDTLTANPIKI